MNPVLDYSARRRFGNAPPANDFPWDSRGITCLFAVAVTLRLFDAFVGQQLGHLSGLFEFLGGWLGVFTTVFLIVACLLPAERGTRRLWIAVAGGGLFWSLDAVMWLVGMFIYLR